MNTIIEFLIVAFAVFLLIKWVNHLMPKPAAAPALPALHLAAQRGLGRGGTLPARSSGGPAVANALGARK